MSRTKYQKQKQNIQRYYQDNKFAILSWLSTKHGKRRWLARMEAIELLGGVCVDCGYKKDLRALQFDHEDSSTKVFKISSMLSSQRTKPGEDGSFLKPSLRVELAKCMLRCANCHAIKSSIAGDYTRGAKNYPYRERISDG